MRNGVLLGSVSVCQPSLFRRLISEFIQAIADFRNNPREYHKATFGGQQNRRRSELLKTGLALGVIVYAVAFACIVTMRGFGNAGSPRSNPVTAYQNIVLTAIDTRTPKSKSTDEGDGGGGGGGGKQSLTTQSGGIAPPFAMHMPLIVPTTRFVSQPPVLPVSETLLGDPSQNVPRDTLLPTGDPLASPAPPSDGPGTNGGIGSGDNGGVGRSGGPGLHDGKGGGEGGNKFGPGGHRDSVKQVDSKPVALNRPRPDYTEEARRNKRQGSVRTRVLVGSDGLVKQVHVVRGLVDGLTEEAVKAAYAMRFRPAMKNGSAVEVWIVVEIEFSIR